MTTTTFRRSSTPAAWSAFSACTMTTSPPFMSMTPGPRAVFVVEPLELLERAVGLEHGVEVADEQDVRPGPGMVGDEVAGAVQRRAVDPARLEPERVELGAEHVADGAARPRGSRCRC